MVPPNCKQPNNNTFNLLVRNQRTGKLIAQEPVSIKTGYGVIHLKEQPSGDY